MLRPPAVRRCFVATVAPLIVALTVTAAPRPTLAMDHTVVTPRGGFGGGFGQHRFGSFDQQRFGSFGQQRFDRFGHQRFDRFGRERFTPRFFRRSPGLGFFGGPVVVLPPAYYAPLYPDDYAYAPVPLSNIYATGNGYCCDYQTSLGVQTACQQADGVWRFIN